MIDLDNLRQEGWPDAADEIRRLRAALKAIVESETINNVCGWYIPIQDARKLLNSDSQ